MRSLRITTLLLLSSSVLAVRNLQIASPLQSLTIWDPEVKEELMESGVGPSFRSRFLSKFGVGLQAEADARKQLESETREQQQVDATSTDWASQAASSESEQRMAKEKIVEQAYDQAVAQFDTKTAKQMQRKQNSNKFQFVGVVNSLKEGEKPITWYSRKKPASAKWSVRLVHVNRDAIVKDLYNRGKIDIFGRYDNSGEIDEKTNQPIVTSQYTVRQRSWKNLWNFSPKHLFTDSSGLYWRERRLPEGMYTDGKTVYEASYRYRDGRNGMHKISSFPEFLNSRSIDSSKKEKILKRLADDTPDIVLED